MDTKATTQIMKLSRPVSGVEKLYRNSLEEGRYPITRDATHFTYSEQKYSIPVGAFTLILVKLKLPNGYDYFEILIDFVRKKEPLSILLFVSERSRLIDMIKGNPMFNYFFKDIGNILSGSGLQFTPEVFRKIARTITPKFYNEVTMHLDKKPLIEDDDDYLKKIQKFNPFSIPVDFFSLQMTRSEKRALSCLPTIENFSREPAVEVVEEETNEKLIKKRRN
jgi:hypothetical protein